MRVTVTGALALFLGLCHVRAAEATNVAEVRGVWIANVDCDFFDSPENIRTGISFLARHGFTHIFPVVWNKAETTYPSRVMQGRFGYSIGAKYKGWDPLKVIVEEAHRNNLKVIPWFEFGMASSYNNGGGPILQKYPHWAAQDREGRLLKKNGFEWLNGFHPEVQEFLLSLIVEVISNYDVDGIQGDDRLPSQPIEGGYDSFTIALYQAEHHGASPPQDFRTAEWVQWRAGKLSDFAGRIYRAVKDHNPKLLVSWSPYPFYNPSGATEYLQDWPRWLRDGHADMVHPQAYSKNMDSYRKTIDLWAASLPPATLRKISPGILVMAGSYLTDEQFLVEAIRYTRSKGFGGEVLFHYEGLLRNHGKLAEVMKAEFDSQPK